MARFLFYDDRLIFVLLKEKKQSGGAAVQSYAWMRGLKSIGHEIVGMTELRDDYELSPDFGDFEMIPFFDNKKGIRRFRWLSYRIPFLVRSIRKNKPDYFVQGIPDWSSFFLGLICTLLGVKLVIRASSDNLIDDRVYSIYSKLKGKLLGLGLGLAYAIICQNEYQFSTLKQRFPRKKLVKLGNPFFNVSRNKLRSQPPRYYIAWVGLFQHQKNLKLLYEIASYCNNETFKIAGVELFSGADKETLYYLDKLHLLKNVEFVGFLANNELYDFLAKAKFLLNTSHYEGFSNTYLESMNCGTPILTTVNANPDNIIENHNLGLIYDNPEELCDLLNGLSKERYSTLSENCISYLKEYHDYINLSKDLVSFLNK